MGVPKFFRWLSERYPKINQRAGFLPEKETCLEHFGTLPPDPINPPDPLSTCGLPPPIDRLYIDMNGIIHGCSHNNSKLPEPITHDEIFRNIAYYLDRIVGDIAKPTELVYMSIDGVAPRAKLNQQRSRRYRSGNEEEIEETIYAAHMKHSQQNQAAADAEEMDPDVFGYTTASSNLEETIYAAHIKHSQQNQASDVEETDPDVFGYTTASSNPLSSRDSSETLQELEPGRFTGKFESHAEMDTDANEADFHHNAITPGTEFFQECTDFLEKYIQEKVANDPKWQHLTIIFSGPNVPGEGEHKIMDFIRRERKRPNYNPNLRHCIMGQDGDWIMLGLATHEPNLVLLREQVIFEQARRNLIERGGIESYTNNCNFEWLHMSILRDYLSFEFETSNVVPDAPYDLEATIDDFVLMTFFVGNDFLPHLPALDIADEAFDLLFYTYKRQRKNWQNKGGKPPYLSHAGNIVSGRRLEQFVTYLGQHEFPYYDNKKREQTIVNAQMRKSDSKFGRESTIPEDSVIEAKEESDRAKYREMLKSIDPSTSIVVNESKEFSPVVSKADVVPTFLPSAPEQDVEDGLFSRMASLLQYSVKSGDDDGSSLGTIDDQDLKGRYYYDKFGFTPFDAEKHIALRKAYIEGLVWNLKYYYEGCVSWEWYYPYHYGPMLSDLVNIDEMLAEVAFEGKGEPLKPFEQLLGCMPPSSAHVLPEPYRWLLQDESSPIADFYPRSFTVDMNGKRWPWEAVVLLPFIDSRRLIDAARKSVPDDKLTEEERQRNTNGNAWVIAREAKVAKRVPLESTQWDYQPDDSAVMRPKLAPGVRHPQPGFPTLKEAPVQRLMLRNVGINVFGMRSRYRTALLVLGDVLPAIPPVETLGKKLIGTTIFINYPFLTEAFVTAISNSEYTMRGTAADSLQHWKPDEALVYKQKSLIMKKDQAFGEKLTGTGGWMMPDSDVMVSVRPLEGLKTLPNGSKARVFAKFEVDLPLTAAVFSPSYEDYRLTNTPVLLEREPYFVALKEKTREDVAAPSMLPEYDEPVAEKPQPLGPILPHVPENDAYAPSVILPSFEEQDPPVMHPPHEETSIHEILPPRTSPSLLPPSHNDIAAFASRGFATNALRTKKTQESRLHGRRSYSTTSRRLTSTRAVAGNPRVRFLVLGAAAAAMAFNSGGAHALQRTSWSCRDEGASLLSSGLSRVFEVRPGGQDITEGSDVESLIDDVAPPKLEFAHGTTTLSFVFDGGIVAAVDSRASLGNFVGSKTTQKVLPVNTHMLGTMAGGAADCSYWIRALKAQAQLHELTEGRRMSVVRASRLLSNALYNNRASDLSVGTMIMGFDPDGPRIFYVDNTGVRINGDVFAVGSGSTFALGILDTERRKDMTEDEAIALGIKAIRHATFRDAGSGGFIGVYVINKDGWRKVFSEDIARSPRNVSTEEKRD